MTSQVIPTHDQAAHECSLNLDQRTTSQVIPTHDQAANECSLNLDPRMTSQVIPTHKELTSLPSNLGHEHLVRLDILPW
jgi:hypothetical protein